MSHVAWANDKVVRKFSTFCYFTHHGENKTQVKLWQKTSTKLTLPVPPCYERLYILYKLTSISPLIEIAKMYQWTPL